MKIFIRVGFSSGYPVPRKKIPAREKPSRVCKETQRNPESRDWKKSRITGIKIPRAKNPKYRKNPIPKPPLVFIVRTTLRPAYFARYSKRVFCIGTRNSQAIMESLFSIWSHIWIFFAISAKIGEISNFASKIKNGFQDQETPSSDSEDLKFWWASQHQEIGRMLENYFKLS